MRPITSDLKSRRPQHEDSQVEWIHSKSFDAMFLAVANYPLTRPTMPIYGGHPRSFEFPPRIRLDRAKKPFCAGSVRPQLLFWRCSIVCRYRRIRANWDVGGIGSGSQGGLQACLFLQGAGRGPGPPQRVTLTIFSGSHNSFASHRGARMANSTTAYTRKVFKVDFIMS